MADGDSGSRGALVFGDGGAGDRIDKALVGRSRLDGIRLAVSAGITLSGNTSYLNGGSGFAISDLEAGKPVETPTSQPYGCAVKYAE